MSSPRARRVGIKDVAAAAGVSMSTVSHALNGRGRVDPATRQRISEVADRLGYRPNVNAVNLLRERSKTLALTVSSPEASPLSLFDVEFFIRLANAATSAALHAGYALVITPYRGAETFDGVAIDGGIVIDPEINDPLIAALDKRGIPLVTSGRDLARADVPSVDNDLVGGLAAMLDHLHDRGAERIALLTTSPRYSYGVDVRAAYESWCAGHGMAPLVHEVGARLTETAGYEAAMKVLGGAGRADALLTAFDCHAAGAVMAARELGLAVPCDLLLATATDSENVRSCTPPITALDLHPERSGRQAVALLIERIEGGSAPTTTAVTLPYDLVERASTARAANASPSRAVGVPGP